MSNVYLRFVTVALAITGTFRINSQTLAVTPDPEIAWAVAAAESALQKGALEKCMNKAVDHYKPKQDEVEPTGISIKANDKNLLYCYVNPQTAYLVIRHMNKDHKPIVTPNIGATIGVIKVKKDSQSDENGASLKEIVSFSELATVPRFKISQFKIDRQEYKPKPVPLSPESEEVYRQSFINAMSKAETTAPAPSEKKKKLFFGAHIR